MIHSQQIITIKDVPVHNLKEIQENVVCNLLCYDIKMFQFMFKNKQHFYLSNNTFQVQINVNCDTINLQNN